MKLALMLILFPLSVFAQQDLATSNRDSTQNGVLSGTTQSSMRDDYRTAVPSTQQVAPSQTSNVANPVNALAERKPTVHATEETVSGTTQSPAGAGAGQ